jgi:DNA-binding Lrp family transcriptional regulator
VEWEEIKVSYILINTKPDKEYYVYNRLLNESKIIELKPLYREFDMIAKVEIDNTQQLGRFITNKIKSLDGVIDTKTLQ